MKQVALRLILTLLAVPVAGRAEPLADGFQNPPAATKPWCYWYWISDNLSKEGITRDLEAMARVGIGEALIGNIFLADVPAGKVKVFTPAWWEMVAHAMREGGRVGVNIGMFNCPGWSQSGGPWIQPEETMRRLATAEVRVTGPAAFRQRLPVPQAPYQEVAVLAFPAPRHDQAGLSALAPKVTCQPACAGPDRLFDGALATVAALPAGDRTVTVECSVAKPFTARSLEVVPGAKPFGAEVELLAAGTDGTYRSVRRFRCDRTNMAPGVGFLPQGPVAVSFPAVTSRKFRLVFSGIRGGELAELRLSGAARLEAYVEKQLGKMHPTPLPQWDTYLWPTQPEPEDPALAVAAGGVRDLTKLLRPDGTLEWEVPAGEWIIQRIGMTPTGMKNSPASPEGQGPEVDKMNRRLAQRHFDAFIGEVLRRVPAADRKAFTRVIADSYEMGSQNWTDGFAAQFRQRYGYDPVPWLPVLTGRLVAGADRSERFLWDLRRLVADRVATDYVGGLRDACRPHGLGLWLENYGHWGFPGEFLQYGGASDRIGGEYWVTGDLGSIECRAASSCANTYGKPFVSAESFTGGPAFQNAPAALKARGDWAFCEGVNHFVLHVYIQQPWEDKVPGVNAWFGTEFNRHNTWFERSRAWIDYLRRSCWMLQQGNRVADVAYFIGEDAPKMTGSRQPELPPGRDFDDINAEVIVNSLTVKDGLLVLPHGTTYRVLALPALDTMRPEVLRKIRDLVAAGATVVGTPPSRSPSMADYPQCDDEVRALAAAIWGRADTRQPGEARCGKGRVIWGKPLAEVLAALGAPPDFESSDKLRYTHRRAGDTDIYFVANPTDHDLTTTAAFRVGGKAPECWWPDSGRIDRPAVYEVAADGRVRLPLAFGPYGSVCVVFREPAAAAGHRVVSVRKSGLELLGTRVTPVGGGGATPPDRFTFAAWIKPAAPTTLTAEANRGVVAMHEPRNDVFDAPHGNGFSPHGCAGCGLAVGTNGVSVHEHGAGYFVPVLVHAADLTDWTHLAVVYRDGRPHLYLNGKPARSGLSGGQRVYSGAGAGVVARFRGQAGSIREIGRALDDAEVAALAKAMPRPDPAADALPPQVVRSAAGIDLVAGAAGVYELVFADGAVRPVTVAAVPPPVTLAGPWEVGFTPGWGAPERIPFADLTSWTERAEPGIRHYSGKAVYRKSFVLDPARMPGDGARLELDLGVVRDLAQVRLNGRDLGTLWIAPFRVDVTEAVRPGANELEIEVVNVWNNRLIGDLALPAAERKTYLQAPAAIHAKGTLLPAGLLGPVRLRHAATVRGATGADR